MTSLQTIPRKKPRFTLKSKTPNHLFRDDYFVSISGDRGIVGAYANDDNGTYSGSAYMFHWNGSAWVQEQKLLPSDGAADDYFGSWVSVSGDVAIGGAQGDDDNGADSGSAYVFRWNGSSWVEEQKLLASDGAMNDIFGVSVTVSGDVTVVGTYWDDDNGSSSGSAYVFRWNGSSWVQEQKLLASDGASGDLFGWAVSVSGNVAAVGALLDECVAGLDCGSAYVFRWNGSSWVQEQKLLASDGTPDDKFGISLCVSGDAVVVGAHRDDDNGTDSGSAYVFRWNGSSWVQEQKLLPSDGAPDDLFGWSVSVSGGVAAVGAIFDNCVAGVDCGSAYMYDVGFACLGGVAPNPLLPDSDGEAGAMACDGGANYGLGCTTCAGGDRDALLCYKNADCPSGGTCAANHARCPDATCGMQWPYEKNRFISVEASSETAEIQTAIRVTLFDLDRFDGFNGQVRWVGPTAQYSDPPLANFTASPLECDPYFDDWTTVGLVHVFGAEVVPRSIYKVQLVEESCPDLNDENCYSAPLWLRTAKWGDVVYPFALPGGSAQPDGGDVDTASDKFIQSTTVPMPRVKLRPNVPDPGAQFTFSDLGVAAEALNGEPYPFSGPCPCPPTVICGVAPFFDACGRCTSTTVGCCLTGTCTLETPGDCDTSGGTVVCGCDEGNDACVCPTTISAPLAEPDQIDKNRYLSFDPNNSGTCMAFRVKMTASTDFSECVNDIWWVGFPDENGIARLQDTPLYRNWNESVIHVGDRQIVPDAAYDVQAIHQACDVNTESDFSSALGLSTAAVWGDIVDDGPGIQPTLVDIAAVIGALVGDANAPPLTQADLAPVIPDKKIDLRDVLAAVTAFEHTGYPFGSPCATVSTAADHQDLAAAVIEGKAVLFTKVLPGDIVPGGAVDVEVFIEVQDPNLVVELSSYQITLEVLARLLPFLRVVRERFH